MCSCIGRTNVLTNPDPTNLTLATLTQRFESERELSQRDILCLKVALVALIIIVPAVTIGLTYLAIVLVGGAPLINLAAMAAGVGGLGIWAIRGNLPHYELRLQKGIFEELLKADDASLTDEKIRLFERYGAECEQLEMPDFLRQGQSGKHLRLAVPARQFFDWAERVVGDPGLGDSLKDILGIKGMRNVITRVRKDNNNYITPWHTEWTKGTGLDAVSYSMSMCKRHLNNFSIRNPIDNNREYNPEKVEQIQRSNRVELQRFKEKVDPIIQEIHDRMQQRDTLTIGWDLAKLATILGHCRNLKLLFLEDEFRCFELFQNVDDNTLRQMQVRGTIAYQRYQCTSPRLFPRVENIFRKNFQNEILPEKENARLNDGAEAHYARVELVQRMFNGEPASSTSTAVAVTPQNPTKVEEVD